MPDVYPQLTGLSRCRVRPRGILFWRHHELVLEVQERAVGPQVGGYDRPWFPRAIYTRWRRAGWEDLAHITRPEYAVSPGWRDRTLCEHGQGFDDCPVCCH